MFKKQNNRMLDEKGGPGHAEHYRNRTNVKQTGRMIMRTVSKRYMLAFAAAALVLFAFSSVQAASFTKDLSAGKVKVHYPSPAPAACEAILLGVGTAMSREGYDNLASAISAYGYVVVIMDHAPGNMIKTDATKFRNLALAVRANLVGWLAGSGCSSISHWLMGGHSAGGQAAQNAVSSDPTLADAVFSIDPYNCSSTGNVVVPAMYWGFDVTTCFVTKEDAAEAAYYGSMGQRAFYRVDRVYSWGWCGYSPKYFHCSFADNHCPACTNCWYTPGYFFSDVARSVNKFINAAFYGTWSKSALSMSSSTPLDLFVDGDQP